MTTTKSIEPFAALSSTCVVLPASNVDTDQIIPARFLKTVERRGLGAHLFADWRLDASGSPRPEFPLNSPAATHSAILVAGDNFGSEAGRIISELRINRIIVPPAAVDGGAVDGSVGGAGSGDGGEEIATVPLAPVAFGEGGPAAMVTDPLLAGHLADSADDGMVDDAQIITETIMMRRVRIRRPA